MLFGLSALYFIVVDAQAVAVVVAVDVVARGETFQRPSYSSVSSKRMCVLSSGDGDGDDDDARHKKWRDKPS